MQKKIWLHLFVILFSVVILYPGQAFSAENADDFIVPIMPEPELSLDGQTLFNASALGIAVDDPNPNAERKNIPAPASLTDPATALSTFEITYQSAGQTDPWGETCYTVPEDTKAAFNYAGTLWGNLLQSSVPIKIQVCWGSLTGSTLGYSGGGPFHRDFTGAPRSGTWYMGSLANSLAGTDLSTSKYDMYITYNKNFTWYTGTDGNPPVGYHDLVTVALHEICHGLNFAGSMDYSSGAAQWGWGTGYPNIYDTFMRDGSGNSIINTSIYPNGSTSLGSVVTSNNLWFHGSQAMSGNGGTRVKMYAPSSWSSGSSYAHLDYTTFASGNNQLMRYAISSGTAIHDPGPVTMGLLKDVGWKTGGGTQKAEMTSPANGSTLASTTQTFTWTNVGASQYYLYLGSTQGGYNYCNKSAGTSTSMTVSGLPSNGSTIYARLWTLSGSNWLYNDYTYKAYSGGGQKAEMTSPTNGSTLASTTQTFTWTNVGASQYYLYLGSTQGGYNYCNKSAGTSTSMTVSGLPSNGSTIYATLWTLSGSTWLYNQYTYKAYSGGAQKAEMTSPVNGSTLASTTQTFTWTNVGASQYYLYLGSTQGGYNYCNKSAGTSTSMTVSGLPSNGSTIYATLWTLSGSTWLYNQYSYKAYSGGTGGFNSQFNGSAPNWLQDAGSWNIYSSQYYYTAGRAGYSNSSTYNQVFSNLDYSAKLWRSGDDLSANRLFFAVSGAIGSDGHFSNEYSFQYDREGSFSIFKRVGGVSTKLLDWTESSAIVQGSAWNTLRVKVYGSTVYYYINGTHVATTTGFLGGSGRVGVGMYCDTASSGNGFWVDWAVLTIPSSLAVEDVIDQNAVVICEDSQEASVNVGSSDEDSNKTHW